MKFLLILTAVLLSGCANPNLVGLRGDGLDTRYGLQDRRAAKMHIKVFDTAPLTGFTKLKAYKVERCNQYAQDKKPSRETLTDDLIMLAYAEGADAISDIAFDSETGLLKNCWTVERATGMFLSRK
jgi:hypothetical protein